MKFLADEGFPKPLSVTIRKFGHSVKTIQQINLIGSSDQTVTKVALKEKRVILTFDKDFLKNKFKVVLIIVFDFPKMHNTRIKPLIESFLDSFEKVKTTKSQIFKFSKEGLVIINSD